MAAPKRWCWCVTDQPHEHNGSCPDQRIAYSVRIEADTVVGRDPRGDVVVRLTLPYHAMVMRYVYAVARTRGEWEHIRRARRG